MELDFIKNYNNKYPKDSIFVLKHFTKEELIRLSMEIYILLEKDLCINLAKLNYINNLSEKELILKTGEENKGIIKIGRAHV
jgi:hypothetical protein